MWNRQFFKRVHFSDISIKMQVSFWGIMLLLYFVNYLTWTPKIAGCLMLLNLVDIPIAMFHFFILLPLTLGSKRLPTVWAFPLWFIGILLLAVADGFFFASLGTYWLKNTQICHCLQGGEGYAIAGSKELAYLKNESPQILSIGRNFPEAVFAMLSYASVMYANIYNDVNEALKERNQRLYLQKQNVDLEYEQLRQKQAAKDLELEYLKIRIDQHTLFNALDSIYFAAKKKLDTTPNITLKLKELMRYLVREIDTQKIPLERDFEVLQHYVDLKMLELEGADISIRFNLPTEYDKKLKIAPMILLVFIENVFKHGIEKVRENRYGHIEIRVEGQTLFLETINPNPKRNVNNIDDTEGKGIALTRRRLKRMYPERHEFTRIENKDIFKLNLQIELDYE